MSKQIYVRLGISDLVITKEEYDNPEFILNIGDCPPSPIGFEDADATDLDEAGNALEHV